MNFNNLVQALQAIRDRLGIVLEADSSRVLDEAILRLKQSKQIYDSYRKRRDLIEKPVTEWGLLIYDAPLRFKSTTYKKYQLRADITCDVRWTDEGKLPICQQLVLRMWCSDPKIMYREFLDSERILELITDKDAPLQERVMARYHFDLANQNQSGPTYHFQLGGNAVDNEYVWFPKELDLPRFVHHPFDLILLCQFVVANFFPEEYSKIRRDPTWRFVVKRLKNICLWITSTAASSLYKGMNRYLMSFGTHKPWIK